MPATPQAQRIAAHAASAADVREPRASLDRRARHGPLATSAVRA
jgi:hypothetical protein